MSQAVSLEDEELRELKASLLGFVKRVASEEGRKSPEEVAILPGVVQCLQASFIFT